MACSCLPMDFTDYPALPLKSGIFLTLYTAALWTLALYFNMGSAFTLNTLGLHCILFHTILFLEQHARFCIDSLMLDGKATANKGWSPHQGCHGPPPKKFQTPFSVVWTGKTEYIYEAIVKHATVRHDINLKIPEAHKSPSCQWVQCRLLRLSWTHVLGLR